MPPDDRSIPTSALPPIDAGSQETDHSLVVRAGPDPLTGSGT